MYAYKIGIIVSWVLVLQYLFSCKPTIQKSKTAYIIGSNDIELANKSTVNQRDFNIANAAVLLVTELDTGDIKFCSGTLIKDTMQIVSNHHCFANVGENGAVESKFIPEACRSTHVLFGYNKIENLPEFYTRCEPGSLSSNPQLDVSVFSILEKPDDVEGLEFVESDVLPASEVKILHYPYIQQNFEYSEAFGRDLPRASITKSNCTVEGPFSKDITQKDPTLAFAFRHTCDLIDGSSGSSLIEANTAKIAGINWGGIRYSKGGETISINASTQIKFVKEFIEQVNGGHGPVETLETDAQDNKVYELSSDAKKAQSDAIKTERRSDTKSSKACGAIASFVQVGGSSSAHYILVTLILLFPLFMTLLPSKS